MCEWYIRDSESLKTQGPDVRLNLGKNFKTGYRFVEHYTAQFATEFTFVNQVQ